LTVCECGGGEWSGILFMCVQKRYALAKFFFFFLFCVLLVLCRFSGSATVNGEYSVAPSFPFTTQISISGSLVSLQHH
jgi:hypothetical protein